MTSKKTIKIIMAALMAALTCIATMVIRIPTPTGGYIHLGDGLVLLCGILLGPLYGGTAAGIGSMFADIFSGYAGFALPTLLIKALAAVVGSIVYHFISNKLIYKIFKSSAVVIAGIFVGFIVTLGYFAFEGYIMNLGFAAAISGVPFNLMQNAFGIVVSLFLLPVLTKVPMVRDLTTHFFL